MNSFSKAKNPTGTTPCRIKSKLLLRHGKRINIFYLRGPSSKTVPQSADTGMNGTPNILNHISSWYIEHGHLYITLSAMCCMFHSYLLKPKKTTNTVKTWLYIKGFPVQRKMKNCPFMFEHPKLSLWGMHVCHCLCLVDREMELTVGHVGWKVWT